MIVSTVDIRSIHQYRQNNDTMISIKMCIMIPAQTAKLFRISALGSDTETGIIINRIIPRIIMELSLSVLAVRDVSQATIQLTALNP